MLNDCARLPIKILWRSRPLFPVLLCRGQRERSVTPGLTRLPLSSLPYYVVRYMSKRHKSDLATIADEVLSPDKTANGADSEVIITHEPTAPSASVPPETKSERFTRLAQSRVTVALKRIGYLIPLANPAQYASTPEQQDKILSALRNAVQKVELAFRNRTDRTREMFTL